MDNNIEYDRESRLWWPVWEDRKGIHYDYHTRHLTDANVAIKQCKKKRVCFQAGGNVGIWPNYFSLHFDKVITAEADPDLYRCLVKNKSSEAMEIIEGAVGNEEGSIDFYRTGKSGTGTVCPEEHKEGSFSVRQFCIDDLNLETLDLIYLDIEGYEEFALRGAVRTLEQCKPIVCCEMFERTKNDIDAFLKSMGYKFISKVHRDHVYAPR